MTGVLFALGQAWQVIDKQHGVPALETLFFSRLPMTTVSSTGEHLDIPRS